MTTRPKYYNPQFLDTVRMLLRRYARLETPERGGKGTWRSVLRDLCAYTNIVVEDGETDQDSARHIKNQVERIRQFAEGKKKGDPSSVRQLNAAELECVIDLLIHPEIRYLFTRDMAESGSGAPAFSFLGDFLWTHSRRNSDCGEAEHYCGTKGATTLHWMLRPIEDGPAFWLTQNSFAANMSRRLYGGAVRLPDGRLIGFLQDEDEPGPVMTIAASRTLSETDRRWPHGLVVHSSGAARELPPGLADMKPERLEATEQLRPLSLGDIEHASYAIADDLIMMQACEVEVLDEVAAGTRKPAGAALGFVGPIGIERDAIEADAEPAYSAGDLVAAIKAGDLAGMRRALVGGASPDSVDPATGKAALHLIAERSSRSMLRTLMPFGPKMLVHDRRRGWLPSHYAGRHGLDPAMERYLMWREWTEAGGDTTLLTSVDPTG